MTYKIMYGEFIGFYMCINAENKEQAARKFRQWRMDKGYPQCRIREINKEEE